MKNLILVLFSMVCLLVSNSTCFGAVMNPNLTSNILSVQFVSIHGYTPWYLSTVSFETTPSKPISQDILTLTLSGQWPNSCKPSETRIRIQGRNIYVDLLDEAAGWICATVITGWSSVQNMGPLNNGTYEVYLTVYEDNWNSGKSTTPHLLGNINIGDIQLLPEKSRPVITHCEVNASKTSDSIRFSGVLNTKELDLSDANNIVVSLDANDMPQPLNFTFPVNNRAFKNGNYNYARMANASEQFFKLDTKTGKMQFSAKHVDLAGLACPITVTITIGDDSADIIVDETIVNSRRPCPIQLMTGLQNTLTVNKFKFKAGKKPYTDSFIIRGTFTLNGTYDKANPLVIILGTQTFTVQGDQFQPGKTGIESCKKAATTGGAIVDAKFDFVKCTYSISVKNAEIADSENVNFALHCFGIELTNHFVLNAAPFVQSSTVKECQSESSAKWAQNNSDLRFAVTVQGQYVQFEDLIQENCCKEDILLGLSAASSQILLEENVILHGMCACICEFPIEATLGPFKPGRYRFKVVQCQNEGLGQTIGETTVIIE